MNGVTELERREDGTVIEVHTTHIVCNNPLTYEEILNWRGFSFETSRIIANTPIATLDGMVLEADNGTYGIEESERIIDNVLSKKKGY